jgi:hypothetical protein
MTGSSIDDRFSRFLGSDLGIVMDCLVSNVALVAFFLRKHSAERLSFFWLGILSVYH